eukprot:Seg4172.1 transcript_id=Seg4172.1/GoldUCD/mRNA.D3Y31 product="hypothetical protein" protein_id=Seg4172.1/GoldUCD/D3Y31
MVATESDAKSDKVQTSILLTCIGQKGRDVYNTFTFETADDKLKLKPVLEKFTEYCQPRKNITFLRYKFFSCRQKDGQLFDDFVTDLKKLSAECEFSELNYSLVRDMIIVGCSDNRLRERLLREDTLELKRAVHIGQAAEQTKLEIKEFNREDKEVHKIVKTRSVHPQYRGEKSSDGGKISSRIANFVQDHMNVGNAQPMGKSVTLAKSSITFRNVVATQKE